MAGKKCMILEQVDIFIGAQELTEYHGFPQDTLKQR